jgi:hypothetical protein
MFDLFHGHLKIGAQSFKKDLHKFSFFISCAHNSLNEDYELIFHGIFTELYK